MEQAQNHPVEYRYGWVMVGVTAVMLGIANGAVLSISVFLKPLVVDFGWLRGEVAGGYTVAMISLGTGGILMGHLADRFPVRRIVVTGVLGMGSASLLLSTLNSPWQFYLYYCVLGGVGVGALFAPLISNVSNWFGPNRGLALGITTAGQALGQGFVPYLARLLISEFGWRGAYTAMGVGILAGLLPLALLVRRPPLAAPATGEQAQPAPGPERFAIPPKLAVAWLSVAVIFCCTCMATPLIHAVALGQDRGIAPNLAATILLPIYVAGFFGRILAGKVADWVGGLRAYWIASAGQTAAVYWFVKMDTIGGFYALGPIFGLFFAGVLTTSLVCVNSMTPVGKRGVSTAIVLLFAGAGMGLGGWQGGYLFDLTGGYTLPFATAAGAGVINLFILGALYLYQGRRQAVMGLTPVTA